MRKQRRRTNAASRWHKAERFVVTHALSGNLKSSTVPIQTSSIHLFHRPSKGRLGSSEDTKAQEKCPRVVFGAFVEYGSEEQSGSNKLAARAGFPSFGGESDLVDRLGALLDRVQYSNLHAVFIFEEKERRGATNNKQTTKACYDSSSQMDIHSNERTKERIKQDKEFLHGKQRKYAKRAVPGK